MSLCIGGKILKLMYVREKNRARTNNISQAINRIGTSMNWLVKSLLEQKIKENSGFSTMYYLMISLDISLGHTYQLKNYALVSIIWTQLDYWTQYIKIILSGSPNMYLYVFYIKLWTKCIYEVKSVKLHLKDFFSFFININTI